MQRNIVGSIFIGICVVGCTGKDARPEAGTPFVLQLVRTIPVVAVASVSQIVVIGDSAIVARSSAAPPFFALINLREPTQQVPFGQEGDGPGELRSSGRLFVGRGEVDHIWVYEGNRYVFNRFDLFPVPRYRETRRHQGPLLLEAQYSRDGLVGMGIRPGDAPVLFGDSVMEHVGAGSPGQPYAAADFPGTPIFDANEATMSVFPQETEVAVGYHFAPLLQVLKMDGTEVWRWTVPGGIKSARIDPDSPNPGISSDLSRISFTRVATFRDGIVAIYCGCLGSDEESARHHVFRLDRNGTLIGEAELSGKVGPIAITADGSRMFVGRNEPQPAIDEYAIDTRHRSEGAVQ